MRCLAPLALLTVLVGSGNTAANPIVISHRVYIAAETLDVTISQSEAKVAGTFLLASVANQDQLAKKSDVLLQIPIWFPSPDLAVHKNAKAFWATFKTDRLNYLNDENRRVLDDVIGLQLTIGKERIECKTFSVFTTDGPSSERLPKEWHHAGFCCLLFHFEFSPDLLKRSHSLSIGYRQPLLSEGHTSRFVYVPFFHNLPSGSSTDDIAKYSITVTASPDTVVTLSDRKETKVLPSRNVKLPLSHQVAIRAIAARHETEPSVRGSATKRP